MYIFDRELVAFMLNWEPYGGLPDDDAVPLFGFTGMGLIKRAADIVDTHVDRAGLTTDDRTLMVFNYVSTRTEYLTEAAIVLNDTIGEISYRFVGGRLVLLSNVG